ncbi:2,4-dihydroxyhept-2-ene-1,7-dioic acid aldolase [Tianweitania sp. BSSL-BM11]|uniref:2,4-dihydroxyhept-2-ene-1,7-dioic acid aldolase n=1 Tax=Tianweitania aestuarii TaxID=2814886 RepID=A0ABS5RUF0_9HYPH|nr:aldolase/citrate lyase family protein [Tianweitania aestuarii]MBS9720685.1 2,4-dihydroxyhept-2-ene-1,7-dioic acid aldolase [Tianweitania aestuarii]
MTLRERLQSETLISTWSGIPDALTVELLASQPGDAVTLDMQHGGHDEASVLRSLPMILHQNKHALVRIPVGRFDMASRALDFGAEAVIAPMINSVADAQSFAAAMKYPPLGERSWGPNFAAGRSGKPGDMQAWLRTANTDTLAIAMIETRRALDALDGILAVDGIDAVLVGPSDFSIAWTNGATVDPSLENMMEAIADIARRATDSGKLASIFVVDPGLCGRYEAMGYRLMACGTEGSLMRAGATATMNAIKASLKG